jgi:hypothetical protein
MSNENPSNHFHWKNKLEDLEHLPGEAFNKDMAWDKLYGRLRGKQSTKKILWYWIAAACLLFAMIITLVSYYKGSPTPSHGETAVNQSIKNSNAVPVKVETFKDKNINKAESQKNRSAVATNKSYKKNYHSASTEFISKAHLIDTPGIYLQNPAIKTLPKIDITSVIATASAEKKKLNVVHINELGDPVTEFPDVVRKTDKHFKIKLANEEVIAGPSVASKTTGFSILKTKLSSN